MIVPRGQPKKGQASCLREYFGIVGGARPAEGRGFETASGHEGESYRRRCARRPWEPRWCEISVEDYPRTLGTEVAPTGFLGGLF